MKWLCIDSEIGRQPIILFDVLLSILFNYKFYKYLAIPIINLFSYNS